MDRCEALNQVGGPVQREQCQSDVAAGRDVVRLNTERDAALRDRYVIVPPPLWYYTNPPET